jgi:hypothetical protein
LKTLHAARSRDFPVFYEANTRDEIHRVQALLGVHHLGQLGPQYLKLVDPTLRAPKYVRRPLQAVPAADLAAAPAAEASKPR